MLLEWVEPGGAGTHCGLGPFFGHYPLIFYPLPVNYNDFPPWPLRTGVIPSPVWALWIVPSDPSRWFFPRVCVVAANSCLTLCDPLNCSLPGSSFHGDSPGKNTGVGSRSLLQEILPISSGNFFTYMDSAEDLRGDPLQISGVLSAFLSFSGILPCDHWLSWLSKINESSPSLCWKRSLRGPDCLLICQRDQAFGDLSLECVVHALLLNWSHFKEQPRESPVLLRPSRLWM